MLLRLDGCRGQHINILFNIGQLEINLLDTAVDWLHTVSHLVVGNAWLYPYLLHLGGVSRLQFLEQLQAAQHSVVALRIVHHCCFLLFYWNYYNFIV